MYKRQRLALPNAEIMIHQPSGGAQGQATEIEIVAEQILRTKEKLKMCIIDRDDSTQEKLVGLLDEESGHDIKMILSYEDDEMGSRMTTNFIVIHNNLTIRQAMRELVQQAGENEMCIRDSLWRVLAADDWNWCLVYEKDNGSR